MLDPGVTNEEEMASDMFEFFQNWFTTYPQYSKLPFFIAAESYGGHYAPALAHYVQQRNNQGNALPINLRGVLVP